MRDLITIHYDDIIYRLQRFGGASEYWTNITKRVAASPDFTVKRDPSHKQMRWLPSSCSSQIFHSSHFRNTYSRRSVTVSTVHDMNYELGYLPRNFGAKINILERKRSYFASESLVCISEQTKNELLEVYPQLQGRAQINVIHHGCEFIHATLPDRTKASALGQYILFVGGRQNYKRFEDLLLAFEASSLKLENFKIVCTGAVFSEGEMEQIRKLNLLNQVVSLGKVSQSHLSALYESAYCLAYPSVREGFGMPLIEAMLHSCPVIACNVSCIPEITADAALLVQPTSPESISAALFGLSDAKIRKSFVEAGLKRAALFSWVKSAQAHMDVYRLAMHVR